MPSYATLPGPTSRPDPIALRGGLVLFGASYGIALGGAAAMKLKRPEGWLAVPFAGPWIALARDADPGPWPLLADGVLQIAGAAIVAVGFIEPRRSLGPAAAWAIRPDMALHRDGTVTLGVRGNLERFAE